MAEQTATAATFLFTDIEGSTQLLKRLRDRYGGVLAQHQQLLRQAFAAYGGQEVDTQGDAFFVAFARARDAVLAAVDAQRSLAAHEWPDEQQLRVRIGIHTGEAALAENRYVGLSVHRAARICALGRGGQILVSQTTRHVLEDDEEPLPGIGLRDLGEHTLKDLARPVQLSEIVFEQERDTSTPELATAVEPELRTVLPGALALESAFPFVGRAPEFETLESLLPVGVTDRLSVALLSGEPGSGKTRLVRELAREAASRGVLVLYGTSDAVVNSPYKPFVEALGFLVRVLEPDLVRSALGTGGGELTRLVPELSARLGPFPAPVGADPDTERHRLHTAVGDVLLNLGCDRPLLLVLDDVQWADAPTLHLLRHLARAADVRMLLLAAFRPEEPDSSRELSDTLADLSRLEGVTRLRLTGLDDADVEEFVRRSSGAASALELRSVALSLEELTEGNPFLLCELWRTLLETGAIEIADGGVRLAHPVAELATPDSVRDVVQFRLARLADTTKALLEVAAIVGAEFELSVLRAAAGLDEQELYRALEEAVRAGTIEEVPGPGLSHRFTHELVRRALADGLTRVRRAELHLSVAEALERVYSDLPARVLPDLAHHFTLAAAVGGTERAVGYNVRAAEAASASLAFEDAAARLTTALELGVDDDRERARLELERGLAHQRAGQTPEALAAFAAAAEAGRSLNDAEVFARAALGYENAGNQPMATDERAVVLLREALSRVPAEDSALRARLLSALSRALIFVGEEAEARALRGEATVMARRLGDPATLATILIQEEIRNVHVPREDVLERLTEARDLALELRDADVLLEAMWRRVATLAGLGDLDEARRECENLRRIA
jgi:class 3 adenylate cyclase/tetratricopeptide (TPR) repeat protein